LPALTQSTAPFAAQMSTLAAIWSGFLPFTILSPDIPPASTIRKYKVHFEDVMPCYGSSVLPVFILAFLDGRIMMPNDIRTYLLDDETVPHTASAAEKRARGLRIVDTWQYDGKKQLATFWLREDVMQQMMAAEGHWMVQMFRTDTWGFHSSHEVVKNAVKDLGFRWID